MKTKVIGTMYLVTTILLSIAILLLPNPQPIQSSPQKYTVIDGNGAVFKDMFFVKENNNRIIFKTKDNKTIVINGNFTFYEQ